MDLVNTGLIAVGCLILGIVGGFAARSWFAGVMVGVFVFVGWFLWRMFKVQEESKESEQTEDNNKV
jgi:hypothetical protein